MSLNITVLESVCVWLPLLTIAASFHLAHPVEGICDQVGESPIEVYGGQTALVPVPGCNQFGQIAVHVLYHATDVQLSYKKHMHKPYKHSLSQAIIYIYVYI